MAATAASILPLASRPGGPLPLDPCPPPSQTQPPAEPSRPHWWAGRGWRGSARGTAEGALAHGKALQFPVGITAKRGLSAAPGPGAAPGAPGSTPCCAGRAAAAPGPGVSRAGRGARGRRPLTSARAPAARAACGSRGTASRSTRAPCSPGPAAAGCSRCAPPSSPRPP